MCDVVLAVMVGLSFGAAVGMGTYLIIKELQFRGIIK